METPTLEQALAELAAIRKALGEYQFEGGSLVYFVTELVNGYKSQLEAKEMFKQDVVRLEKLNENLLVDSAMLDFLEDAVEDSRTGVTSDMSTHPDNKGFRVMWFHKQFERKPTMREAIQVAMDD